MATASLDQLKSLAISQTEISSNIKNITNLSVAISFCKNKYNGLDKNVSKLLGDMVNSTGAIKDFTKTLSNTIDGLNNASNNFTDLSTKLSSFTNEMTGLSSKGNMIDKTSEKIDNMNEKLDKSDKNAKKASSGFSKLGSFAKRAIKSISVDNLKSGADMVDNYIKSTNRLAKIKGKSEQLPELQNKVNTAANRSSTSYTDMADAVSTMGSLGTFKSSDETIAFTELMQKSLKLDGSDQKLSDVSKSMSDGAIQGDEFSSLINSAPTIGEAMSKATGKSVGQLQTLAEQGMITADVLKNAMFASSEGINQDFSNQPKTFADIWTQISNSAMNALNPIMQLVSNIINSQEFQGAVNVLIAGFSYISSLVSSLVNFIMNNGDLIQALLISIGIVLLGVLAMSLVSWIMMYAPILLIIGAITAIIFIISKLGISFQDVFSFVGGIIGLFYANFYNTFVRMWNSVAAFINFFGNVFSNPIASIKILFYDLVTSVLTKMLDMAKGIQGLLSKFGIDIDITSNLDELNNKLLNEKEKTKRESGYRVFLNNKDTISTEDTVNKFGNGAAGLLNKLNDFGNQLTNTNTDYSQFGSSEDILGTTGNPTTVQGTGSNGSVVTDIEDEDLGYLRDMAERDYIANVATNTLAPNISVSFGDVHETADANQLFGRIQTILQEQIAVAPEGVY